MAVLVGNDLTYIIREIPVTKKNSQQILMNRATGRPFVAPSRAYKEFEEMAGAYLRPRPRKPLEGPVNVLYRFYMPTRRRVDLSNLISAMDDVLVKHRILTDDNRDVIAGHDGSRVYHDKDDPRVEVVIQAVTGYKQWRRE